MTESNAHTSSGVDSSEATTGHEYDGITEYDNPLPRWWKRTFWLTFWFSVLYYIHYQLSPNGPSVLEEYDVEMSEYRAFVASQSLGQEMTEAGLAKLMADPGLMKDGRALFLKRCLQCHADQGQGNIGPNLTDEYWLYGSGTLMDIHQSVSEGRTLKGMPAWSRLLSPLDVGLVTAYVGSIRNTNVAGRPPQGQRVSPAQPAGDSAPVPTAASLQDAGPPDSPQ